MYSMDFFAGAVGLSQFRISAGGVGEIVAGFVCAARGIQAKLGFPFRLKPYMTGDKTHGIAAAPFAADVGFTSVNHTGVMG